MNPDITTAALDLARGEHSAASERRDTAEGELDACESAGKAGPLADALVAIDAAEAAVRLARLYVELARGGDER